MIGVLRRSLRPIDVRRWTLKGSVLLGLMMMLLMSTMLTVARNQAWDSAERHSANVRQSVIGEIKGQLELYSTLIDIAAGLLSGPDASRLSQNAASLTLGRMVRDIEVAGIIIVLDRDGYSVLDSTGKINQRERYSDRPYFTVHRDRTDVGLFLSQPYRSRLRNDDPTVALSRRISDANGNFAGVVVAAIRLDYIRKLFSRIDLGVDGALSLVNGEGVVLMRHPSSDGRGDVGRDVSRSANFRRAGIEASGSRVGVAAIDGIERLMSFGRVEGFPLIAFVSTSTREILSGWWRQVIVIGGLCLTVCGALVVLALGLRRKIDELDMIRKALFIAANTDQLTGLANRREFDSLIRREWQRAMRDGTSLSLLMVDADHFKCVNDQFGHAEGDDVLRGVAFSIRDSLKRACDVAARYGGEEFAVVLPNTDCRGALTVAEAVRKSALATFEAAHSDGRPGVTVSVGGASIRPSPAQSVDTLIEAADTALYEAKRRGRNRSWMAEPEDGTVVPLRPMARGR